MTCVCAPQFFAARRVMRVSFGICGGLAPMGNRAHIHEHATYHASRARGEGHATRARSPRPSPPSPTLSPLHLWMECVGAHSDQCAESRRVIR